MGPEHAPREKILSKEIFLFSCTKMYIELDSKISKSGVERVLRKSSFSFNEKKSFQRSKVVSEVTSENSSNMVTAPFQNENLLR